MSHINDNRRSPRVSSCPLQDSGHHAGPNPANSTAQTTTTTSSSRQAQSSTLQADSFGQRDGQLSGSNAYEQTFKQKSSIASVTLPMPNALPAINDFASLSAGSSVTHDSRTPIQLSQQANSNQFISQQSQDQNPEFFQDRNIDIITDEQIRQITKAIFHIRFAKDPSPKELSPYESIRQRRNMRCKSLEKDKLAVKKVIYNITDKLFKDRPSKHIHTEQNTIAIGNFLSECLTDDLKYRHTSRADNGPFEFYCETTLQPIFEKLRDSLDKALRIKENYMRYLTPMPVYNYIIDCLECGYDIALLNILDILGTKQHLLEEFADLQQAYIKENADMNSHSQ